jgi:uncharacterized protein YjbI with pentapeptide repeats
MIRKYTTPPSDVATQLRESAEHSLWLNKKNSGWQGGEGSTIYFGYAEYDSLDMRGAVLIDAVLQEAALINCMLDGATFSCAMANGMRLDGSSARGAVFVDTQLDQASFRNCDLTNADFRESVMTECDFTGAVLRNATLSHCTTFMSRFVAADLSGVNASFSGFKSVDFSGSILTGANMTGSSFSSQTRFLPATPIIEIIADYILLDGVRVEGQAAVHVALTELATNPPPAMEQPETTVVNPDGDVGPT